MLLGVGEADVRARREAAGVRPVYKTVDTCGAEFEAFTPYLYSTYEPGHDEAAPTARRKIVILGGGPNRIGQGIEFDYCCVHAALALREDGFETIMVNCNPETVSTDYDTSDKLFFEPLTFEDALALIRHERPDGVIVQFGGQTPLRLAVPLERAGVPIIGTPPDSIDRAEDRERFEEVLATLDLRRPPNGIARSDDEAERVAEQIGYPVLVRPSYVLGGRAMEIVYDRASLGRYMRQAVRASPEHPVLIDQFLEDAIEVDVDAVSDGTEVVIGGIMEHIERAGVHSGDSACSLPPYSIDAEVQADIRRQTVALARELGVVGLMNVQFAVKDARGLRPRGESARQPDRAVRLQGHRRAARQDRRALHGGPLAARPGLHAGDRARARQREGGGVPVHQVPRRRHRARAGDEVDGRGDGHRRHLRRRVREGADRRRDDPSRRGQRVRLGAAGGLRRGRADGAPAGQGGLPLLATLGTGGRLREAGLEVDDRCNKVQEGAPNIVELMRRGEVALVVNTPSGAESYRDSFPIRRTALECRVPYFTTIAAAAAAAAGIETIAGGPVMVRPLQEHYGRDRRR